MPEGGARGAVNNKSNSAGGAREAVNNRDSRGRGDRKTVNNRSSIAEGAREVCKKNKNTVQALKHPSADAVTLKCPPIWHNCFQNVIPIIEDQW